MNAPFHQLLAEVAACGAGQVRAAARLMSLLENSPEHVPALLAGIAVAPQPRLILGITGPPGSGKSTLTDGLVAEFRRRRPERRVGVIAVDPSSAATGGAVLGDRVRMMRHATDPNVFIRSLASRGRWGGLTSGIRGVVAVMGLLRSEVILIETVGVGQNEIEIAGTADCVAVVFAPGLGDSVQLLKAGLTEIGDLFVVNKADRPGASELQRQILSMLRLRTPAEPSPFQPPGETAEEGHGYDPASYGTVVGSGVHSTCATEGTGVPELVDELERRCTIHGRMWRQRRGAAIHEQIRQVILDEAVQRVRAALDANGEGFRDVDHLLREEGSVQKFVEHVLRRAADGTSPPSGGRRGVKHVE